MAARHTRSHTQAICLSMVFHWIGLSLVTPQYFYTIFLHAHTHTHLINLEKFVGRVVCSEEKMQRLLTKTRFIKWGRLRNTLCQAHRSIQGTSFRSTKVAGSILTIGGCGEGDCCNRRDVWRQWSHPCAANWETFLLIASTAAFILACLRCNLALFWKISLICSCCCSRFNIWLLRYRREAALFWRMARWARCCTFCLVDSFEILDGRGGRE